MKKLFYFLLIAIVHNHMIFSDVNGQQTQNNVGYYYNFSISESQNRDYIVVPSSTQISKNQKFGFVKNNYDEFTVKDKWTEFIPSLKTGIEKNGRIDFKAEVEPCLYYLEIQMNGGNTGHWQGEISVNNSVIVDELYSFTTDPESDEAPNYWSIIRKIKLDSNEFLFSVKANNQQSSLSSLALIPVGENSLKIIDGKTIADKNFIAPNSKLAIDLINKGFVDEGLRIIDSIPERMFGVQKLQLLMAVAGRLETKNPRQLVGNANRILNNEKQNGNGSEIDLKITELYSYADQSYKSGGWDW